MANLNLMVFENGKPRARQSASNTLDFVSVRIGTDNLTLSDVSGSFDFGGSKLTNIAAGTASGQAVEFDQLTTALGDYILTSAEGANNGVATLDSGGKIPVDQLPNSVMEYLGIYDPTASAGAGSPALADGTGNPGDVYRVSVAGSHDFGSGSLSFVIGDYVIYNGTIWQKSHGGADSVLTVNGQAGTVVLTTTDVSEGTSLYFTTARAKAAAVANAINSGTTDVAPSEDAVFQALALKANDAIVVKTVNGQSPTAGAVTLTSSNITEGSNLYFTDARAQTAAVEDAITSGVTNKAPSEDAVFQALALKQDASTAVTSVNGQSPTAGDVTLTTSDVAEGSNLYFTTARAKSAAVANSITSGVTDVAPSQDAVYQALAASVGSITAGDGITYSGGTITADFTKSFTNDNAGTISAGQVVMIKANGHVDLAVATTSNLSDFELGVVSSATIATTVSGKITVRSGAIIGGYTGMTPGKHQYLDASTAGALTETAPSGSGQGVYQVGRAISATQLKYDPSFIVDIV